MQMHRFFKLALAVLAATTVISAVGCSSSKSVTIGIAPDASPLSSRDEDGNPQGYIVEMAREAGKRMGMEVRFKYVDVSDGSKNFTSQNVDAIWGLIEPDSENEKTMLFTKGYLKDRQVLVVESSSSYESSGDLYGKKIGVVSFSQAHVNLAKSGLETKTADGKATEFKENVSAFAALDNSEIDALAVNETYARYVMTEHAERYRILSDSLASEEYCVAVRRNDSRLRDSFQSALDEMDKDGTAKSISNKWFGIDMV